jgi:hypothetical protein
MHLSALHIIEPAQWPDHDVSLTGMFKRVRQQKRFPRRARVVAWGLHESASASDPATRAALRPLIDAGFRIESVLSPPKALALLAGQRQRQPGDGATAWLALNRHGAAIAIVKGTSLLFSREFDWSYRAATRPHEQLLQRYSLVAHLAPELRRGMQMVRTGHGIQVDSVVTCGDLPDLRSLTMPLIEELDIEVETLDSVEGLEITGPARSERVAEYAQWLRLACAVAAGPAPRGTRPAVAPLLRVAAGLAGVGLIGWLAYVQLGPRTGEPTTMAGRGAQASPPSGTARPQNPPQTPPTIPAKPAVQPSPSAPPQTRPTQPAGTPPPTAGPPPAAAPPAGARPGTQPAAPRPSPTPPAATGAGAPAVSTPPVVAAPPVAAARPKETSPSAAPAPKTPPGSTATPPDVPPRLALPPPPAQMPAPRLPPAAAAQPPPPRADTPQSDAPARPRMTTARTGAPLKDPLPAVHSILVSADRRLAVLDGLIVREGDAVGVRVLVRIEPDAVVLREPSGFEIRVSIRGRPTGRDGENY